MRKKLRSKASRRARSNRDKGVRNEQMACEILRPIAPDCRRNFGQSRSRGEVPDIGPVPGYWVEVGAGGVNPRAKWEQACEEVDENALRFVLNTTALPTPIALTRRTDGALEKRRWLVTMSAEAFVGLVRKAREYEAVREKVAETLRDAQANNAAIADLRMAVNDADRRLKEKGL